MNQCLINGPIQLESSRKLKKILICIDYFEPGYLAGGPIRSVLNLCAHFGEEYSFFVITRDRDLGDTKRYPNIETQRWYRKENYSICYVESRPYNLFRLYRLLREVNPDVIYLNSFCSVYFSIVPVVMCRMFRSWRDKVLLAPRGEFSSAALQLKAWRKRAFIRVARKFRLYDRVSWHASSDFEASDIFLQFGQPYSIDLISPLGGARQLPSLGPVVITAVDLHGIASGLGIRDSAGSIGQPLQLVLLSRICPIKNVEYALDVLFRAAEDPEVALVFDIYGPIEDQDYWLRCEERISNAPGNLVIRYCGSVRPEEVAGTLSGYDMFFLPTQGENFGHVIAEALSAGCMLLISDQTPWQDLEKHEAGWVVPLAQPSKFIEIIRSVYRMDGPERVRRAKCAGAYMDMKSDDAQLLQLYRNMFDRVTG